MNKEELRRAWSERVAEYKTSGLAGREWCELRGLKQHPLWYWVKRENKAGAGERRLEVSLNVELTWMLRVTYVAGKDCYICPLGQVLKRTDTRASRVCPDKKACEKCAEKGRALLVPSSDLASAITGMSSLKRISMQLTT